MTPKSSTSRFALIPLLAVAVALVAGAAEPPAGQIQPQARPQSLQEPVPARPGLMELPRESLSPRLLEIREFLEGRNQQIEELTERYQNATDDTEAMRLMSEIHVLKAGTEVELLKLQLRHAREDGRTDVVAQLEETLAHIDGPPTGVTQVEPPRRRDSRQ